MFEGKTDGILSSEDIRQLMLNMEKENEILEAARKLLLIMLTDLKDSTVYYDRLGDIAAKSILFKHNNILFPIIENHHGTIIKTTGDGVMATFEHPDDGINAAAEIQRQLMSYNADREPESTIVVRIGLHYGKILHFENDVYGDTINTTARIESLADGNEIVVSDSVVQVSSLKDDELVNIGRVQLKGKLEPVQVYGYVWNAADTNLKSGYQTKQQQYQNTQATLEEDRKISLSGTLEYTETQSGQSKDKSNPFLNRSAISIPDYFFGREALIHRIYSRISAQRPQSVSLYGERRIGKSSLLNQLRSYKLRKQYLQDINKYVFLYIDVQSMRSASMEHFIGTMYDGIKACFAGKLDFHLKPDYQDFTKLVQELSKADINLILMFDEFDLITLNPVFDVEFYSWLRSLASHYKVAFITSSLSQLQQLCASKKISDSPFFNIFTAFQVGPFSPVEAEGMVHALLSTTAVDYDFHPWMPEIVLQAGYLPFFLQIYCSNLYEMYPLNPSQTEVAEAYREEARDHFDYLVRNLPEEEKECLQAVAEDKKISPKLQSVLQQLTRKGYLIEENGKTRVFSHSIQEMLKQMKATSSHKSLWSKLWNK